MKLWPLLRSFRIHLDASLENASGRARVSSTSRMLAAAFLSLSTNLGFPVDMHVEHITLE